MDWVGGISGSTAVLSGVDGGGDKEDVESGLLEMDLGIASLDQFNHVFELLLKGKYCMDTQECKKEGAEMGRLSPQTSVAQTFSVSSFISINIILVVQVKTYVGINSRG